MKQLPDYEPIKRSHLWDKPATEWPENLGVAGEATMPDTSIAATTVTAPAVEKLWLSRRGHFVSFVGLFLFTFFVYFRPYELFTGLRGLSSMAFWLAIATLVFYVPSQLAIETNLTAPLREVKLILLLGLAGLLSIPVGDDASRSWDGFSDFLKVILMFIVMVNVVRTEWRLKVMILLGLAVSLYLSIDGLIKYRTGLFDYEGYRISGGIGGMFVNPNDLALQLVTTIPLAVGLFLYTRNILLKLFFAFCTVLMLSATVITYSRGGFVGLVAAAIFLAWKLQKNSRFIVIGTMVLAMAMFVVLVPSRYGSRMRELTADGSATSRRDDLIRSTIVAIRHPLLGVGINNYILRSNGNHASHNAYTQVASEMGIPAMVVYILFLLSPLKRLRAVEGESVDSRRKQRFYYLAVALQASLVAFMVSSFFASVAFLWYAYYLTGYAVCLDRLYRANWLKDTKKISDYPVVAR